MRLRHLIAHLLTLGVLKDLNWWEISSRLRYYFFWFVGVASGGLNYSLDASADSDNFILTIGVTTINQTLGGVNSTATGTIPLGSDNTLNLTVTSANNQLTSIWEVQINYFFLNPRPMHFTGNHGPN